MNAKKLLFACGMGRKYGKYKLYGNVGDYNQLVEDIQISDYPAYYTHEKITKGVKLTLTRDIEPNTDFEFIVSFSNAPIVFSQSSQRLSLSYQLTCSKSIKAGSNIPDYTYLQVQSNVKTLVNLGIRQTNWANISSFYFKLQTTEKLFVGDTIQIENVNLIDFQNKQEITNLNQFYETFVGVAFKHNGYLAYTGEKGALMKADLKGAEFRGRNLLGLQRTQGTLNGGDYSRFNTQNFKENEYYLGLASNDYIFRSAITNLSISGKSITFTSSGGGYGVALPIRVKGGETYYLSYKENGEQATANFYITFYDINGNFIENPHSHTEQTKNAPSNAYWGVIIFGTRAGTFTITDILVQLATETDTTYSPYISPIISQVDVQLGGNDSWADEWFNWTGLTNRKSGEVEDLSTLQYTEETTQIGGYYTFDISANAKRNSLDIVSTLYTPQTTTAPWSALNNIWIGGSGALGIANGRVEIPKGSIAYALLNEYTQNNPSLYLPLGITKCTDKYGHEIEIVAVD